MMNEQRENIKPTVQYEDFAALDIRVGTVVEAELIEGSEKLIRCRVDCGEGTLRTVVSGLARYINPEELVGRQFPYVVNLAPRTIFGVESQGMILAVGLSDDIALLEPSKKVPPGSSVN